MSLTSQTAHLPLAVALRSAALLAAALFAAVLVPAVSSAQTPTVPVAVFPAPGTRFNLPGTQIAFRGIPVSEIGPLQVTGSKTGVHTGHLAGDSDGDGGSFLPDSPFAAGETVTVVTDLDLVRASSGTFSFQIAHPAPPVPYSRLPLVLAGSNGVQHFQSRPDLQPAALTVTKDSAPSSNGDIFVAPQFGPTQDGPMILDSLGQLVWFQPYPVGENRLITDFREQQLFGAPVLTWWQGNTNAGTGRGEGIVFNSNYQQIATVHAANGLDMDLHEFLLTPGGDAYIASSSPVFLPGISKTTLDSVVQEIDVTTGLLLFEWHALDHVGLNESYFRPTSNPFDPYHVNSISVDVDGNLIVSMRNTSTVYKIDHTSGVVIWRLGGKHSSFKMGKGTTTWGQHDAIAQPDGTLTVFDDGAGPPMVHPYSRGIRERLDTTRNTATLIQEFDHAPRISADFEGSLQTLPNGDVFLGWGQQPYFSEDTPGGQQDFDAHFNVPTSTYRAYRFPWSAQPPTQPALALSPNANGTVSVFASWNGATDVGTWRVLAGAGQTAGALAPVAGGLKRGFETQLTVQSAAPDIEVQAIGYSGQVLASSAIAATPAHIAVYGSSGFVSPSAIGSLPVGCFTGHPCHVVTAITAGKTTIARTTSEGISQNGNGIVYFRLSPAGHRILARDRRLPVQVSVRDVSGATASTTVTLIPFNAGGAGPRRSVTQSRAVQIAGETDFVSSQGVGGILAGCTTPTPCQVTMTASVGRTVIARTGPEYVGAGELGYVVFKLTSAGRTMLARASGNQLGVQLTVSGGGATATAQIALIPFS